MFTGIIEEIGQIQTINKVSNGINLTVSASKVLLDVKLGDSIAIDGVCQTVVKFDHASFTVEISQETLTVTTFNDLKTGQKVNLERALKLSDRLGGHIVSGHVDGIGKLVSVENLGISKELSFFTPKNVLKYIVYKGSICISGISLTVSKLNEENQTFTVAIIPHTLSNTTLLDLKIGEDVNLESDILAKYTEKLLMSSKENPKQTSNISTEFLAEHGFV